MIRLLALSRLVLIAQAIFPSEHGQKDRHRDDTQTQTELTNLPTPQLPLA